MKRKSKLYLLKDRIDYVKKITDDEVVNVIGTKGSGKTTSSLKYINDENYIVINCDRLYEMPVNDIIEDKYLSEIRNMLKDKYGNIPDNNEFLTCYNDILDFVKKKNKKVLIEGNVICNIELVKKLRGTIIIKRTGIIKCFIRTIKRDYPIKYFLDLEIEKYGKVRGRINRLENIIKRRKNIFNIYHEIEDIIDILEK